MNIAAIIVGIDGWEQYTLPLMRSIREHEPKCRMWVIDNASKEPYYKQSDVPITRTERLCYSAAINLGKRNFDDVFDDVWGPFDWYIVLSNDVKCTGPFAHILEKSDGDEVIGPLMRSELGFPYIEGWCMCFPRQVWEAIGGFDEAFLGSDYEDVDVSTTAREKGFWLAEDKTLPFVHLDQRQRFYVVDDFAGKNAHNRELFLRKHARVTA